MQKLVLIEFLIFTSTLVMNFVFLHGYIHAQSGETSNTLSMNIEKFTTNQNMFNSSSTNTTRIMENTSGMIDDALNIIKDKFGPFFGK
jgi:hypothetical protein